MAFQISPFGNDQFFTSNGVLAVGAKLFTYLAGTTTKTPVYTDVGGITPHTNPIILNSLGMPPSPIFLDKAAPYKFVYATSTDTDPPASPIYTADNVSVGTGVTDYSVIATGTTAVRTFANRFADIDNVKDFGAVGDGVTNDAAGIQAALNAMTASGRTLYFPRGIYLSSARLTGANKHIGIAGDGMGVTEVRFTGAVGGFSFSFNDMTHGLAMHDLTITTNAIAGGTAIAASWPVVASSTFRTATLFNLDIRPNTPATNYWTNGIVLTDAWNASLHDIWYKGKDNTTSSLVCIELIGASIDVVIRCVRAYFVSTGVNMGGTTEGVRITDSSFVYVNKGVVSVTATSKPGLSVAFTHIAAFFVGIETNNRTQSEYIGNLIYKRQDSTQAFSGISLENNSDDSRIIANHFVKLAGATGVTNGIVIISGARCQILSNSCTTMDNAITLQASATACVVQGNSRVNGALTISNSGTGNILKHNFPADGVTTFALNSATPSVDGSQTEFYSTNNTGATTITNFLGGYTGQLISILANDANTTVQHNANVTLQGGVNFVMGIGAIINLRKDPTVWRETSRRTA